ncbi:MAG: DUF5677 domain-containing protein [Bacilli bacterium]
MSHNFIRKNLVENEVRYSYHKEKLQYFCDHINAGYREYKRAQSAAAGHKTLEEFAIEIIRAHNAKIKNETEDLKQNYYKQPSYIKKIIKDKCGLLISKNDPSHIFTYVNPQEDARVDRLKEIINGYYSLAKDAGGDLSKALARRIFDQMVSGVRLLSDNHHSDAFIIWRSLLENISYLKIVLRGGTKTANLFLVRKSDTKKILGLATASKAEIDNINLQNDNRLKRKSATWWEKQRFAWAQSAIRSKDDLSAKTLQEAVGLEKYYPHYQVASIFTHEHLLDAADFKVIPLVDYLINLYWRAFEEIRMDIILLFGLSDDDLNFIKKHEESIRKLLRSSREQFDAFSNMIS